MFGPPKFGARRHDTCWNREVTLTQQFMRDYWGDMVETLPQRLKEKLDAGRIIAFKYGSSQRAAKHLIGKGQCTKIHLAVIQYAPKSGKY